MKQITYIGIFLVSLVLGGCDNGTSAAYADKTSASKYLKPGAAIDFKHNFKGPLGVGEKQTVELSFRLPHIAGQLAIKLRADSGLNAEPATTDYAFSLAADKDYRIQQTLSAEQAGKYYLKVFAEVQDPQGQIKTRVFAVAVQVGEPLNKSVSQGPVVENSAGERLMLMPAEETTQAIDNNKR
jgi:hypothetical protein